MRWSIGAFVADIAHEVLRAHIWWQAAHEISSPSNPSPFATTNFVHRARTARFTHALVEIEQSRRDVLFQFIMPYLRAIDVLQIYSLLRFIAVYVWAVEELLGKFRHMLEVVLHRKRDILFSRQIARVLDYTSVSFARQTLP
jgi:hypothetical protein